MSIVRIKDTNYNTCEIHALGVFGSTIPDGAVLYTRSKYHTIEYLFRVEKSDSRSSVRIMPGSAYYVYFGDVSPIPCIDLVETTRALSLCSYPTEQELYRYFKVNYGI